MATYVHSKRAAVIHGDKNLQDWMREASASIQNENADTSHFGHDAKTYIVGQNDAQFTGSGLYDGTIDGVEQHMEAILEDELANENPLPITFAPEGLVFGGAALMANAKHTTYEVNQVISDVVSWSFEMQADGGMHGGSILFPPTPINTATTVNGASEDGLASSAHGAVLNAHVLANTTGNNVVVKLQHSTNDSTWVDLATATLEEGAEVVVATGTVNRYLRIIVTTTGSGSVTVVGAAARK